jgi:hypothetical protein
VKSAEPTLSGNVVNDFYQTISRNIAHLNPTSLIAQPAALAIIELLQRCNCKFPPPTFYDLLPCVAVTKSPQNMLNRPLLKLAASARSGTRIFRSIRCAIPSAQRRHSSISTLPDVAPFDLFEPTPVHTHLRETVRAFAETEVDPQANDFNRQER